MQAIEYPAASGIVSSAWWLDCTGDYSRAEAYRPQIWLSLLQETLSEQQLEQQQQQRQQQQQQTMTSTMTTLQTSHTTHTLGTLQCSSTKVAAQSLLAIGEQLPPATPRRSERKRVATASSSGGLQSFPAMPLKKARTERTPLGRALPRTCKQILANLSNVCAILFDATAVPSLPAFERSHMMRFATDTLPPLVRRVHELWRVSRGRASRNAIVAEVLYAIIMTTDVELEFHRLRSITPRVNIDIVTRQVVAMSRDDSASAVRQYLCAIESR